MKNKILHGVFLPLTIIWSLYLLYLFIKTFEKGWDWGWELTLFFHGMIFWVFLSIYFCTWGILKIFERKK